jgi:hypothetical protein
MKPKFWYQGRSVNSDVFDYKFIDRKGLRQDGAGFYFTDDIKDASRYAKGGIILKCEIHARKTLKGKKVNPAHLVRMLNLAPNLKATLADWDEDPKVALTTAFDNYMAYSDNDIEAFQSVWADFYNGYDEEYLKNMVKLGYDATEPLTEWDGVNHLIVFNPKIITVIEKI